MSTQQQPSLPISPEALAEDAEACVRAGASIYHLHVRDASGAPTMSVEAFAAAKRAIEARVDVILQFTSGGAVSDSEESRIAPLDLRPEMATLTTGTVNFGDEVFSNPIPLIRRFHTVMIQQGILPEFEIFDVGMIATADRIYAEVGASHHKHFDFVLGVPGALPAWPGIVSFLVGKLPEGATWSATGIGKAHMDVMGQVLQLGGHLRTGFEDVRYLGPGKPAKSNDELVSLAAQMGEAAGRRTASVGETRAILGLG